MEASAAGAPLFKVTRQDHNPTLDPTRPQDGTVTVYFQTQDGTESSVTVREADYNAETVGRLIAERVRQIEAVNALGQTG